MKKNKSHFHAIIGLIIVACIAFYGGTAYQKSQANTQIIGGGNGTFDRETMMNMSPEERQSYFEEHGDVAAQMSRPRDMTRGGTGTTVGKILEASDTAITVDLGEDGSQLILISDKTIISKPTEISVSELKAGDNIFVSGDINSDSSLTATAIQVRLGTLQNIESEE